VLIEVPSSPTPTPFHDDFQKYGSVVLVHFLSLFIMVSYVLFLILMIVLTIHTLLFVIMRFLFLLFYCSHHSSSLPTPISISIHFQVQYRNLFSAFSHYPHSLIVITLLLYTYTAHYSALYPYPIPN
jgi:hypothetical protein